MLESPKVIFELPRVIFVIESRFGALVLAFRGSSGYLFSLKLILATTDMIFVHMELSLSSNSFAVCFRSFNFLAIQRVNVLQAVNPRACKTSQGIPGGAPLSGSAAVGCAQ